MPKHETSTYLHMIRHFSPFHAPLTPPLMVMGTGNSAPSGGTRALQLPPHVQNKQNTHTYSHTYVLIFKTVLTF